VRLARASLQDDVDSIRSILDASGDSYVNASILPLSVADEVVSLFKSGFPDGEQTRLSCPRANKPYPPVPDNAQVPSELFPTVDLDPEENLDVLFFTPLMFASRSGATRAARELLARRASRDYVSPCGVTALLLAVDAGDVPLITMVASASNVCANSDILELPPSSALRMELWPLFRALLHPTEAPGMVKALMDLGADIPPEVLHSSNFSLIEMDESAIDIVKKEASKRAGDDRPARPAGPSLSASVSKLFCIEGWTPRKGRERSYEDFTALLNQDHEHQD
jgi:ankyrin repeat protein